MTVRRRLFARAAAFAALLAGPSCVAPPATRSSGELRFVVGEPYSLGGVWSYPREEYGLAESGLAAVLPDTPHARRTADGEVYDPTALTAAHRTLQLPAVLRVWALDTGREVRVRVNDRGPEQPGRVIGLSRRTAELLGLPPDGPARVRIAVDPEGSRLAIEGLPGAGGPRLAIAAAPVGAVEREQLVPLPGFRAAAPNPAPIRVMAFRDAVGAPSNPSGQPQLLRLPEEVVQRGAVASRLMVEAGVFHRRDLAERRATAVGGHVEAVGSGRQPQFRVRSEPFANPAEADRALEAAFRHGTPDAMITLD